jgi:hypothetical protein
VAKEMILNGKWTFDHTKETLIWHLFPRKFWYHFAKWDVDYSSSEANEEAEY